MATIDSYVVHSRINPISSRARKRLVWMGAAFVSLALVAGLAVSGRVATPWPAKFAARVVVDPVAYPAGQDDEKIAAFQESVAISHLTAIASAPIEAPRPVSVVLKPPRAQKPAPAMVRKSLIAPVPPPRPAGLQVAAIIPVAPPMPVPAAAEPKTPVLLEIVHRIVHIPDRAVEFAAGVTDRLLSLRARVGF